MANIAFGGTGPDGLTVLKGQIPINATFQQYIPVVDEDGMRIVLADYDFELTFRALDQGDDTVALRLSTVTGEITKTTDVDGDVLLVSVDPSDMADLDGSYRCTFAAKDASDVVTDLAAGLVVFSNRPASFS